MTILFAGGDPGSRQEAIQKYLATNFPGNSEVDIKKTELDESGIKNVRDWQNWMTFKPANGGCRILVIQQAQDLTIESQNSLLKLLEEPPENSQIILEANNPDGLLPTVLSRAVLININSDKTSSDNVIQEKILKLGNAPIREKFQVVKEWGTDRDKAQEQLDRLIVSLQKDLLADPKNSSRIRNILKAKKLIKSNVNVRLALENLMLKW